MWYNAGMERIGKWFRGGWRWVGHVSTAQWIWAIIAPSSGVAAMIAYFTHEPLWFRLSLIFVLAAIIALCLLAGTIWLNELRRRKAVESGLNPSVSKIEEIPIWQAIAHVARVIGDHDENKCFEKARNQIRQAAVDGRIKFRGRAELRPPHKPGFHSAIWTEIPESYWIKAEINALASGELFQEHDHTMQESFEVNGFRNRYWTLLARESDIEREWPYVP